MVAGDALGDEQTVVEGLSLLAWLFDVQTSAGHLSPVAVGGWSRDEPRPAFDQQPIEVAALADAAARAFALTAEPHWSACVARCAGWFAGDNDSGMVMYDTATGGGFDGLEQGGRNANQGAESTLAALATMAAGGPPRRRPMVSASAHRGGGHPHRRLAPARSQPGHHQALRTRRRTAVRQLPGQSDHRADTGHTRRSDESPSRADARPLRNPPPRPARGARETFQSGPRPLARDPTSPSPQGRLLGAYFTAEYTVEAAALCNPSMVAHPDQSGLRSGDTRFVLSLRGIGEGHISSIEFRTGVISARGHIDLDQPGAHLRQGTHASVPDKARVAAQLHRGRSRR